MAAFGVTAQHLHCQQQAPSCKVSKTALVEILMNTTVVQLGEEHSVYMQMPTITCLVVFLVLGDVLPHIFVTSYNCMR